VSAVKVNLDHATQHLVQREANRAGRSRSDWIRHVINKALARTPTEIPGDALVQRENFNERPGAKIVAAYLSGPLSKAILRLAHEQDRSQSWVLRDLVRCELKRRGILPPPAGSLSVDNEVAAA
jgi:hypothetical protein